MGGGAWGWWYRLDEAEEKRWQEDPQSWWAGHYRSVERTARENYRVSHDPQAKMTEYLPPKSSGEQIVPIIESIACDIPRTFIINIPNKGGYLPGAPADFAVEIPVRASSGGLQGIQTTGLPPLALQALIRDRVVPWEIELEAYRRGSRRLLVELVAMDPWTRSLRQAEGFVASGRYELTVRPWCPPSPGQPEKLPQHIPVAVGLLGADGGERAKRMLELTEAEQTFGFDGIGAGRIVPSLLRDG